MEKLHPKAVWLFFFSFIIRFIFVIIALGFVTIPTVVEVLEEGSISPGKIWFIVGILVFAVAYVVFCYLWARLTYRFWRYELTEHSLKIERGVIWKKYISIPYDRIQNVDIYRGVLDRLLGLSDLQVQTAGYSASFSRHGRGGVSSEGRLPGLTPEAAEQLRETLIQKVKGSHQGL